MKIEFDAAKRKVTLDNRGLDMARCGEIFQGPSLTVEDNRQDYGEARFLTIGYLDGRMVIVVWTPRGAACRVISLRKANDREQAVYGPRMG